MGSLITLKIMGSVAEMEANASPKIWLGSLRFGVSIPEAMVRTGEGLLGNKPFIFGLSSKSSPYYY